MNDIDTAEVLTKLFLRVVGTSEADLSDKERMGCVIIFIKKLIIAIDDDKKVADLWKASISETDARLRETKDLLREALTSLIESGILKSNMDH